MLKNNVDSRFEIDTLKGITAAVARNDKGQFIAACMLKAHDIKQGLQLAKSLGWNGIIISSDNHVVDKVKPKPGLHVKETGLLHLKIGFVF
jgi:hypothetical protein